MVTWFESSTFPIRSSIVFILAIMVFMSSLKFVISGDSAITRAMDEPAFDWREALREALNEALSSASSFFCSSSEI